MEKRKKIISKMIFLVYDDFTVSMEFNNASSIIFMLVMSMIKNPNLRELFQKAIELHDDALNNS